MEIDRRRSKHRISRVAYATSSRITIPLNNLHNALCMFAQLVMLMGACKIRESLKMLAERGNAGRGIWMHLRHMRVANDHR